MAVAADPDRLRRPFVLRECRTGAGGERKQDEHGSFHGPLSSIGVPICGAFNSARPGQ
jgi:hypothetical protein